MDFTPAENERIRRRIRERGLTFEVFLPEEMAEWVKARVAEGTFESPREAAFVAFGRLIDLHQHPEVDEQLLKVTLEDAMNDPRPPVPAELVFAELEAEWRRLAAPDD